MVEVQRTLSCDPWPISDESDDVETPLQVWQRMFGQFRSTSDSHERENKCSLLTISKPGLRRKSRRRIAIRPVETVGSSSEDETVSAKRTRSSKTESAVKVKGRRKKTRKPSAKSTSDANLDVSSSIDVTDSPPESIMRTRLQKRSLSMRSKSKKKRKKPLQFIEEDKLDDITATVSNDENSDSQKTVLLDSPDLEGSYEVTTLHEKCAENYADQPSCSHSNLSDIQESKAIPPLPEIKESDPESELTSDATDAQTKVYDESTDIDDNKDVSFPTTRPSNIDQSLLPNIESTDLDDIFFKPITEKKPPPTRSQKKMTMGSVLGSSTQGSTCSSILDDDSLWVAK